MNSIKIPDDFINSIADWSFQSILLGYSNKYLSHEQVRLICEKLLKVEPELAHNQDFISIQKSSPEEPILNSLKSLANSERVFSNVDAESFWGKYILYLIRDSRDRFNDPLTIIEEFYSDLNYPKVMSPFIRYMPYEGSNSESDILKRLDSFK